MSLTYKKLITAINSYLMKKIPFIVPKRLKVSEKANILIKTKEMVDCGRVIGKYYDCEKDQYVETTKFMIHYNCKGIAYIIPIRPKGY